MTAFERWAIWLTSIVTTVTGVVFMLMKYGMTNPDPWAVTNHPLQPLVLKLHVLTAPLLVFALGLVTLRHVWRHYQSGMRQGRRTGVGTALLVAPMVLTGYLIQVVTHVGWLRAMVWAHIVSGLAYAAALGLHQLVIRRTVRRRDALGALRRVPRTAAGRSGPRRPDRPAGRVGSVGS